MSLPGLPRRNHFFIRTTMVLHAYPSYGSYSARRHHKQLNVLRILFVISVKYCNICPSTIKCLRRRILLTDLCPTASAAASTYQAWGTAAGEAHHYKQHPLRGKVRHYGSGTSSRPLSSPSRKSPLGNCAVH